MSNVIVYCNKASVRFNETSIGWGKFLAVCVYRWSTRNLSVSLSNKGVFLSQWLSDKMESDCQSCGMEFNVETKPTCPMEASSACLTVCDAKLGDSAIATKPCSQLCVKGSTRHYSY